MWMWPGRYCTAPPPEGSRTSREACGPVAFWRFATAGEPRLAAGETSDGAVCPFTPGWLWESLQVEIQPPLAEPPRVPSMFPDLLLPICRCRRFLLVRIRSREGVSALRGRSAQGFALVSLGFSVGLSCPSY